MSNLAAFDVRSNSSESGIFVHNYLIFEVFRRKSIKAVIYLLSIAASLSGACGCQSSVDRRAAEGHGILPKPENIPNNFEGRSPKLAFVAQTSGLYSRTVFETDEDKDFKIKISEFNVPPKGGPMSLTLSSGAVIQMRSGQGRLVVNERSAELIQDSAINLPATPSVQLINTGDRELILRVYELSPKP